MNDMFSNLKEKMNETVLKDIDFHEEHKEKVRQSIKRQEKKNRFHIKPKLDFILSMSVTCLLLMGIGYFTIEKLGLLKTEENAAPNESKKEENHINEKETAFTPPKKEESYEDMSKDEVQTKLLNSIDHFETASGKFDWHNVFYDDSESHSTTEFKISLNERIGIGGYVNSLDENGNAWMRMYINNRKIWYLHDDRKSYQEEQFKFTRKKGTITMNDVYKINKEGIVEESLREHPPIGNAALTLFPQVMTVNYTKEQDLWEIEKQNEEVLGHNTIVLKGKINPKTERMLKMNTFRFWVDKDTGILLKFEGYDAKGNLTCYLHPEWLDINIPLDSKEFTPNLEGYEKDVPSQQEFDNPEEKEVEILAHADGFTEEVPTVLNVLRKNLDFLYEFTHPEMELFSASYHKYQDYRHGYLTYSYKRDKKEVHSGPKLLYVRMYHKDSVVSSWNEFNTERGDKMVSFESNGIKWDGYELKVGGEEDIHYIGQSGDYVYEVLTQQINLTEHQELFKWFEPTK
ncbi:hypothetical protein SM124_06700 [Bacillus sp. 31A1R]|uniref:MucB/RseB N-terminal domain-containing protein n=1 Tax=Robertmurraya mangrovi TaxID=3098077 RepID=A0ABU5IWA4_9BACI|nr:hypothetical protein [Bacillus sp. 31A1R]MDZ5471434.1 hypothetical protein [Bacillus sp. 31A1R]